MKTETKDLGKCQVKLTVTLDADEAKAIVKDVEKTFVREAQIPGFRKGKVPVEIIRKEFASGLKEEIDRLMLRKHYADAVKAAKIDEVALADVANLACTAEGGSFEATVDVKPVFKLPTYKGLKIAAADTVVKDDEVAKQLEQLRAAYAKFEDAKDGDLVQDGDYVQIDYEGTVGGKPILEVAPEAKVVASGKGFWVQVEEGRFLKEILDAVRGMKAGETKEKVKAKFDKEAAPDPLKGKSAVYTVALKAFRRRVLPTDAEFAEKAKAESFDKLQATVREQMEKQKAAQEAARRENEAVELLLKKASFDVPQTQIRNATNHYLQQFAERAQYSGLPADYFEKNQEQILKDAEENAEKQVRLWYILQAIAVAEKIDAKEEERGPKAIEFVLANTK